MFCPKCGNELSLFADKCLSCGKSFMNMSLAERQKLEQLKPIIKPQKVMEQTLVIIKPSAKDVSF